MSSLVVHCMRCGTAYQAELGSLCPFCPQVAREGQAAGAGPSRSHLAEIGMALLIWFGSVALLFFAQIAALVAYLAGVFIFTGERPQLVINSPFVLATLAGTLVAHILTIGVCWFAITRGGKRPFWSSLGWRWHTQFKWVHAVALAFGMLGMAMLFEYVLPHGETEFDRLLRISAAVRYAVAGLAVLSAPFVEEVVYRGVLYSAFEGAGKRALGVAVVTALFAAVHGPQYWGSPAALSAIIALSLVLTLLRASTRQLLPCVATHLIFNAVQAVSLLISGPPQGAESAAPDSAVQLIREAAGLATAIFGGGRG